LVDLPFCRYGSDSDAAPSEFVVICPEKIP
jgi:hypothetical protein